MARHDAIRQLERRDEFSAIKRLILGKSKTAKMFCLFLVCFAFLQELLYISLCGDKDCSQLHILEPAWKFQRNRLTFEEVNNVFQAVHGMSCCHHCIVYNNFRIGKKVRDLIICGLSWIQHPFRISYQQEVFVDSLVTKEKQ
ncbi:uncharacterized protein LOC106884245 [Octopus bimaculoides]|uniref:Uncharacterized protein n=1 Tax=Octopus bimaculoides TaxID=37653 RepID=A0A0L8I4J3_OCTBM|nr:uncharacterized protein LOC106884245 [Octopus bimaculoides]|eukprot:XP_014791001.1 PREDICTED: uncharacterized protein LOC106884245 isoform X1 [Octopus bimaculoides]